MMKHSKRGRLGLLAVGGSLLGAILTSVTIALPAGASYPNFPQTGLTAPANNTLSGSGSSTTYNMMEQMDLLFNNAPACTQFVAFPSSSEPQPLDYSCTANPSPAANQENPFADIAVEEAPLGSSNGIQQLEDQGAHGATANSKGTAIPVADNVNYARSSRALKSTDLEGQNFIGYATDGVTYFTYNEVAKTATPSANVTNLTTAQLQGIYNGTYTNWDQVGGTSAPIVVFSAQEGSGTQSTWSTFLGFDPSAATNQVNCYTPKGGSNTCVGPAVIFENEDAQITKSAFVSGQSGYVLKNPVWAKSGIATSAQIRADAIFFFSTGKYSLSCKKLVDCGGSLLPTGTTNTIGDINSVAPMEANILDQNFPVTRYLYNVYSNGFNPNMPAATAATLNYVSEIGFICNPNKGESAQAVDPLTGKTYISEIQALIEAQGFYPLSSDAPSGEVNTTEFDGGSLAHSATSLEVSGTSISPNAGAGTGEETYSSYAPYDTAKYNGTTGDVMNYCVSFDTDSNSAS
jgi:ABC-type phosphate transport system substrate-binding protein